jgi:hypothetical protein
MYLERWGLWPRRFFLSVTLNSLMVLKGLAVQ